MVGNQGTGLKSFLMGGGLLGHRVHAREANGSGETMRVTISASGCSSEEPASWTLGNDYSEERCLSQESQIITRINNDYTHPLHTVPPDYELLATNRKRLC